MMSGIREITGLPDGTIVRGALYEDPDAFYGLGDVIEVELPSGWIIDVSWNGGEDIEEERPFCITVYHGHFDNRIIRFRLRDSVAVVAEVKRLAEMWK